MAALSRHRRPGCTWSRPWGRTGASCGPVTAASTTAVAKIAPRYQRSIHTPAHEANDGPMLALTALDIAHLRLRSRAEGQSTEQRLPYPDQRTGTRQPTPSAWRPPSAGQETLESSTALLSWAGTRVLAIRRPTPGQAKRYSTTISSPTMKRRVLLSAKHDLGDHVAHREPAQDPITSDSRNHVLRSHNPYATPEPTARRSPVQPARWVAG